MRLIQTKQAVPLLAALVIVSLSHQAVAASAKEQTKPVINLEKGLVSEWRANDTAVDSVGGNNGTTHSGVSYTGIGAGIGFLFDGNDAGINVPDADNLRITNSLTISAWIDIYGYPPQENDWGFIVIRGDDRSGLDPYFFAASPEKKLVFTVESATNESSTIMAPVPLGQAFLATATLDDATGLMRIYANGVVIAQDTATIRPFKDLDPNSNPGIGIGHHGGFPKSPHHMGFNGIISDLRIYNRAITQDEVQALYVAGVTLPKSPLKAKAEAAPEKAK